jgi:hypothetical protein
MPKFDSLAFPQSVALAAPACRLLAIEAWACPLGDGTLEVGSAVRPVLALTASLDTSFARPHRPHEGWPSCPEEAREAGWTCQFTATTYDALIIHEDSGLSLASEALSTSFCAYELVAADWPREEDKERLSAIIRRLTDEAVRKAEGRPMVAVATAGAEAPAG